MEITYVITSYNNKNVIQRCVESVLAQSRPVQNIIIVDDASTDGSQELLRALKNTHKQIHIILKEKNEGAGHTRHLGYLNANTELVSSVDGDDSIHTNMVEREFACIEKGADVAFSNTRLIYPDGGEKVLNTVKLEKFKSSKERVRAVTLRLTPLPHNVLCRKAHYIESGGYDVTADIYEDWSWKIRFAALPLKWKHAENNGYFYYKHSEGLSVSSKALHCYWRLYVIGRNSELIMTSMSASLFIDVIIKAFKPMQEEGRTELEKLLVEKFHSVLISEKAAKTLFPHLKNALTHFILRRQSLVLNNETAYDELKNFIADLDAGKSS